MGALAEGASKDTALIVLGAGRASRFGGADKLGEMLGAVPVALHVLEAFDGFEWGKRILVHSEKSLASGWVSTYADKGFECCLNRAPETGMAASLQLGIAAAKGVAQALICLADMPLITPGHIQSLLEASANAPDQVIASSGGEYLGPPAILPAHVFSHLPAEGDKGARALMRDAARVAGPEELFADIDTPESLAGVRMLFAQHQQKLHMK